MKVRKLDANGDATFGHGINDFWVDVPDGVGQVVGTTLKLQQGEWFADTRAGVPYATKVIGKYTGSTRDIVLRTAILNVPGVTAITAFNSNLNRDTRAYTLRATIDTAYGSTKVNVTPQTQPAASSVIDGAGPYFRLGMI